jgi:hypothetical protein
LGLEDVSDFDVDDEPLLSLFVLALVPFEAAEELPPLEPLELPEPLRESVR